MSLGILEGEKRRNTCKSIRVRIVYVSYTGIENSPFVR